MRRFLVFPFVASIILTCASPLFAQDIEHGAHLYDHNLNDRATEVFIDVVHSDDTSADERAEALYWLGQIAFDENRYNTALSEWSELVEEYPDTEQAHQIAARIDQLSEIVVDLGEQQLESAIASSWIRHGDFWFDGAEDFTIDSSWLPKVEIATDWYDRVIEEFPGTRAAEVASQKKLFTLLGWDGPGRHGSSYGLNEDFAYIDDVIETFENFEEAFPESSYLQAFRYQIGQEYWAEGDFEAARIWFEHIVEQAGDEPSFYSVTASQRLDNLEY